MELKPFEMYFREVKNSFHYLVSDFDYQLISTDIENADDYRDSVAIVRYLSSKVGLEVYWYLASSVIGISLIKVKKEGYFPYKKRFWGKSREEASAITLNSLIGMAGKGNVLILNKYISTKASDVNIRRKMIEENISDIVKNVAEVLLEQANDILAGDTSIFPKVQKYEEEYRKNISSQ